MEASPEPRELLEAFRRVADGVFAVDQQMRVVYWNAAAERIFGIDEAAVLGRRCDAIVAGFEPSGALLCGPDCPVMACARRGHAAETYDLVRTRPGGARQWLNVSIIVLRGRRRASTLAVHLVRDVTSRRGAAERTSSTLAALAPAQRAPSVSPITRRESEVLRLLAGGLSNLQIADALGISAATSRNHIEHLLAKLGAHSRLEVVVRGAELGLI